MNLKSEISPELWEAISSSYTAKIYKSAILDAIHFLSDAIREKADLDIDGEALISKAFGGDNPLLKINKFQTQTEKDEHRGFFFSLKGLYAGIRNPRSHQQYEDSEQTANAIILFVDFLLKQLNLATPVFTIEKWIQYVLDPDFVPSEEYTYELLNEIPKRQFFNVIIQIYRKKSELSKSSWKLFFNTVLKRLDEEQLQELVDIVSDDFRTESSIEALERILIVFPESYWETIENIPRLRIEHKLIQSIRNGKVELVFELDETFEYCKEIWNEQGLFGCCNLKLLKHFSELEKLRNCFIEKFRTNNSSDILYLLLSFTDVLPEIFKDDISLISEFGKSTAYLSYDDGLEYSLENLIKPFPELWQKEFFYQHARLEVEMVEAEIKAYDKYCN